MTFDLKFQDESRACSILVVEDQISDQFLARERLKEIWPDSNIFPAYSLYEAYTACQKSMFDLILLDLNLPDGFGPSSVKEVRRFDRNVPILVLTGELTDKIVAEVLKYGATDIMCKSDLADEQFTERLGNIMSKRKTL